MNTSSGRQEQQPDPVEMVVSDLALLVRKLQSQIPMIEALSMTRQTGRSFIPEATKALMGEQYRKDKRARRVAEIAGLPVGNGVTSAPGNLPGWALAAEYSMTLRDLIRRIVRRHIANHGCEPTMVVALKDTTQGPAPVPVLSPRCGLLALFGPTPPREASNIELARYLYELVWTIDQQGLAQSVTSDLTHLQRTGDTFLNGEPRTALNAACPHCGNRSLVVYIESGVIRCERPRLTDGTRDACRCFDQECPCRTDRDFHHSWLRDVPKLSKRHWAALYRQISNPKEFR